MADHQTEFDHQTESELHHLRHLYEETKNPLYIWEAIALALYAEPIVPEWCLPYLHEAARKLRYLSKSKTKYPWAKKGAATDKHIAAQVLEALSLSKQGKRNAFDALQIDRRDMAHAQRYSSPFMRKTGLALEAITKSKKRNVGKDRAQRLLKRGDRLRRPRRDFL